MLSDDLVADDVLAGLYDDMPVMLQKIRRARKFVLTKDFAQAADGLVENIPELQKVVQMCRVPFPLTWIEFLHDDRPHWDPNMGLGARPVDPSRHQGQPHRVGFLLEQQDDSRRWQAHLFWKLRNIPVSAPDATYHNGSLMMVDFDCEKGKDSEDPLGASMRPRGAKFGMNLLTNMLLTEPHIGQRLLEYALEDWGGEYRFLIAILGLMNARNVVELERVDMEPANKKRIKHGKRPLFTHDLIKVRPFIVERRAEGEGGHRDVRLHFVRGHFKHRRSGLFWWSMHARGDARLGVVMKDYEVEGK